MIGTFSRFRCAELTYVPMLHVGDAAVLERHKTGPGCIRRAFRRSTWTCPNDKDERNAANEAFAEKGIESALCIGLVHEPVGTLQNPDLVAAYEKLPQANGNLQQFVNLESLKLK